MPALTLNDLDPASVLRRARQGGIAYRTGPFNVRLYTDIAELADLVAQFYGPAPMVEDTALCHYHVRVERSRGMRRWYRPQSLFSIDGIRPFEPYPLVHALPLYEWGLNWCIGTTANQHLLLHSAVVERNNRALIMPAMPGSGKSTLCAALIHRGWRLLSDEFGIVRASDGEILPLPRAIPLKNESIGVIRRVAPQALFGPLCRNTRKGDVRHMAPPPASVERQAETATPRWVLFPRYQPQGRGILEPQKKSLAFTRLSNNSFNYQLTMEQGFTSLARLVRSVQCYQFTYSDLDQATDLLTQLADGEIGP